MRHPFGTFLISCCAFLGGASLHGQESDRLTDEALEGGSVEPASPGVDAESRVDEPSSEPAPTGSFPNEETLRTLMGADPAFSRPILRRAARSAPDAARRAIGLSVLARRDPSRATAQICGRALRLDEDATVRRAGAECLGRLPEADMVGELGSLGYALSDPNVDVVTMAGWALANVGDESVLADLSAMQGHPDPRVGAIFSRFVQRLTERLADQEAPAGANGKSPEPGHRGNELSGDEVDGVGSVERVASASWLALYGGLTGWLHGGLFPTAHAGGATGSGELLFALGGAVAGAAAGGTYGFLRAERWEAAHTVVQLGTFGLLTGYGAGMLSSTGPDQGINLASFGLVGSVVGTGLGVALSEGHPPTAGALGWGMFTALGVGLTSSTLALSYGFPAGNGLATGLLFGSTAGAVVTLMAAPYEFGLYPLLGATLGGLSLGAMSVVAIGWVDPLSNRGGFASEAEGWGMVAGFIVGAVLGAYGGEQIPREFDPFRVEVSPTTPQVAWVPPLPGRTGATPVLQLTTTF